MFGWLKKSAPKYSNISVTEMKDKITDKSIKLIDVRSASEVSGGAIKGHQQIDVMKSDFKDHVSKLDTSKTYIVYCKSGMRSRRACNIMAKHGFNSLYNLKGGFLAYQNEL